MVLCPRDSLNKYFVLGFRNKTWNFSLFPLPPPPLSPLKPWLWEKCPSPVLCCDAGRDKYQP